MTTIFCFCSLPSGGAPAFQTAAMRGRGSFSFLFSTNILLLTEQDMNPQIVPSSGFPLPILFLIRCSLFDIPYFICSPLNAQRSMLNAQRSTLNAQCSTLNAPFSLLLFPFPICCLQPANGLIPFKPVPVQGIGVTDFVNNRFREF